MQNDAKQDKRFCSSLTMWNCSDICVKRCCEEIGHTHTHRSGSVVLLVGGIGCLVWGCVCVHSVCWCVFIKRSDESGQLKPWTSRMDLSTHVQHGFKDKVRFSRLSFWFSLCVCSYCGLVFTSSSSLYSFSNVRLSAVSPLNIPTHLNKKRLLKSILVLENFEVYQKRESGMCKNKAAGAFLRNFRVFCDGFNHLLTQWFQVHATVQSSSWSLEQCCTFWLSLSYLTHMEPSSCWKRERSMNWVCHVRCCGPWSKPNVENKPQVEFIT